MPDKPDYHKRAHPAGGLRHSLTTVGYPTSRAATGYAELQCKSNFSFLRGASHPEELVEQAAKLGYAAIALTDENTLAGAVRMHCAAKSANLKLIIGAEITPVDAPPILLYAADRASYGRLARIITQGRLRAAKGECHITLEDIAQHAEGLVGALVGNALASAHPGLYRPQLPITNYQLPNSARNYRAVFADRLYLAASVHGGADDREHLFKMNRIARSLRIPMVATNDVHYHVCGRRFLQDVLTCIRRKCTLESAGKVLFANAERHLRSVEEMERLFADYPEALARTTEIAERCRFSLDELRYEYPEALCPPDRSPEEYLAELTWAGADAHYPAGVPEKVRRLVGHELALIGRLEYEPYFLTVWNIVQFARSRGILCQGRGSAANSAVCYCLGITSVDPDRVEMLFERFVSAERNEPPDIDVDFEHERREEVFQYIYGKYGREHAGIVAEVITYRPRSAIRDVGKALGLSRDRVDLLAKKHDWWDRQALPEEFLREAGLDPADRTMQMLIRLVRQIVGFPRHLSQHVGGFVITRKPLCEMVPLGNGAMPDRTFIEWDKDDIDALGILKIDCLALGMLTAIRKCLELWGEGTKGRRDGGTKGHGDVGTEGWRDRETKRRGHVEGDGRHTHVAELGRPLTADAALGISGGPNGIAQDIPRSDCLAEERGTRQDGVSGFARYAGQRAFRTDDADAAVGRIRTLEHCRGQCSADSQGVPALSFCGPGVSGGIGDAAHDRQTTSFVERPEATERSPGRNGPRSSGAHSGLAAQDKTLRLVLDHPSSSASEFSVPSSLRPFVPLSLRDIPAEDPAVYDMICKADTVGVFQIESRAQMSMLPRLKPRNYYDLVIEVAIVRPGPIQGGMVHPYLRRRSGKEAVTYPNDAIRAVLERTLGVPLFQEQAMRLAIVAAGFTPGEADQLRRAMAAWRRDGEISGFRTKLIEGMKGNGLSQEFAERCFEQICGFGEYGFPESHAASFALLVYVSAWLKRYHPAAFCAALLNSQPMGFYQPAQLVRDAIKHGVAVQGVDVNYSGYDCRLEDCRFPISNFQLPMTNYQLPISQGSSDPVASSTHPPASAEDIALWGVSGPAVRLGMRLVKGISREQVAGIERAQATGPFRSAADVVRRSGALRATLARLAAADAFRSLGLDRRQAVWEVLAIEDEPPLLANVEADEPRPSLPAETLPDVVLADYDTMGLSLNAHPMSLIREELDRLGVCRNQELQTARQGREMKVSGIVLVRQRPSTANGILFCTLEDETATANLIIRPNVYEKYRPAARGAAALIAHGRVERQDGVVHLLVQHLENAVEGLAPLRTQSRDFH